MAFSFVQAVAATGTSTITPTVTLGTPATAGNLLVLGVIANENTTSMTLSGWTALTQTQSSSSTVRTIRMFYTVAVGGETTISTNKPPGNWAVIAVEYGTGGLTVHGPTAGVDEGSALSTVSSTTQVAPDLASLSESGTGLVVCFWGVAASQSFSAWNIGGSSATHRTPTGGDPLRSGASATLADIMPAPLAASYTTNTATNSAGTQGGGAIAVFSLTGGAATDTVTVSPSAAVTGTSVHAIAADTVPAVGMGATAVTSTNLAATDTVAVSDTAGGQSVSTARVRGVSAWTQTEMAAWTGSVWSVRSVKTWTGSDWAATV